MIRMREKKELFIYSDHDFLCNMIHTYQNVVKYDSRSKLIFGVGDSMLLRIAFIFRKNY
jgi:hypothetical protein